MIDVFWVKKKSHANFEAGRNVPVSASTERGSRILRIALLSVIALLFATSQVQLLGQTFAPAAAPSSSVSAQQLQLVLDQTRELTKAPGASVAIMSDGQLVWEGSSGLADVKSGLPVTESTLYSLASVTKTFTATMVLRLYEKGKIGLDDPIRAYVPAYMPSTEEVTVRDLLGMTSGYEDVEGDSIIILWLSKPNFPWTRADILTRVQPVVFEPGTRYNYCNTNYIILGAIIDKVSPLGVGGEFQRLIVGPSGLTGNAFFQRVPRAAARIAHGYDLENGKEVDVFWGSRFLGVPTSVWGVVWTDGGVVATASGVAQFTDALFGGRILQPDTLATMIQPGPDRSYGLGTYSMPFDGHEWQGNDGYFNGFTSMTMYDFSRKLTITVLTNYTDNRDAADTIWGHIAEAYDQGAP